VDIGIGYGAGRQWFDSRQGHVILHFSTTSRTTRSYIPWLPAALSLRLKRPGSESDHSPPSSAEIKNGGAIPPLPYTSSLLIA
jgi:hypothetical protein